MHGKQRKHDKHPLLHVRSLTHSQPLLRVIILPSAATPLIYVCVLQELPPAGSLVRVPRLLFCQVALGGGQTAETRGPRASQVAQDAGKGTCETG